MAGWAKVLGRIHFGFRLAFKLHGQASTFSNLIFLGLF